MQQSKYDVAEVVYRKVQQVKLYASMACHLGHCLIKKWRFDDVVNFKFTELVLDENRKIVNQAELMREMEEARRSEDDDVCVEVEIKERLDLVMSECSPFRTRRDSIIEEITTLGIRWLASLFFCAVHSV